MYVKLISKPGQWFKEGTEAYHYYEDRRVTKEEFDECLSCGVIDLRGLRIAEHKSEGVKVGEEYWDGETCIIEEFTYEYVKESK